MSFVYGAIGAFQKGGGFMYPILVVLAVGTAIVIEKFIYLNKMSVHGSAVWNEMKQLIGKQNNKGALELCSNSPKSLLKLLSAGVSASIEDNEKENIQNRLDEVMMEEIPRLELRTHYVPVLANVATLLGLLGTIMGLIEAFKAIAVAEAAQRSMLLAQGVSVAMNTTAFGLVVAIPLMLSYSFLQSKTMKIVDSMDEYSMKMVNFLGSGKK